MLLDVGKCDWQRRFIVDQITVTREEPRLLKKQSALRPFRDETVQLRRENRPVLTDINYVVSRP